MSETTSPMASKRALMGPTVGTGEGPGLEEIGPARPAAVTAGLLGPRGLPDPRLVPAGLEPVPAGPHGAPARGVGATAVQQEQTALRVAAGPQPAGQALLDVRPGEDQLHGEPAPVGHLQFPRDARGAGLRHLADPGEDPAQTAPVRG